MDRIDKITSFYNKCAKKYDLETINEFMITHKQISNMDNNHVAKYKKNIVIDLTVSKPKYGELIHTIQTCIVLKHLGFTVKLYIFKANSLSNHIFEGLLNNDLVMKNAYEDIEEIATITLQNQGIVCKIVEDRVLQSKILDDHDNSVIFRDTLQTSHGCSDKKQYSATKNFFALNQEFLSLLFVQYCSFLLSLDKKYLVGDILREASKGENKQEDKYISTNFRFNPARPIKNGDVKTIISAAEYFYKKYSCKTLVLTCKQGHRYLNKIIKNSDSIIYGSPGNFIEESKLLVHSKLFYQVQGGGIGIWPLFSNEIPFAFLCDPGCLVPYTSKTLFSIHNFETQVFLSSKEKVLEEFWSETKQLGKKILI